MVLNGNGDLYGFKWILVFYVNMDFDLNVY